jgi:hypothetical protein
MREVARDPYTHVPMDALVRNRLLEWPQRPPGATPTSKQPGTWLRARPADKSVSCNPFLKLPGSDRLRTLPDGLWLHFGTNPADPFCDILCIEACSTLTNLLDKRSRFAASTCSLLAVCPVAWLMAPAQAGDPTPRWQMISLVTREPVAPLVMPVRDIKVIYGLRPRHYDGFVTSQMPQAHEYFCPMEALTAERSHENPAMQALIGRASAASNFMLLP